MRGRGQTVAHGAAALIGGQIKVGIGHADRGHVAFNLLELLRRDRAVAAWAGMTKVNVARPKAAVVAKLSARG
jgi:hypothetical protein